MLKKKMQSDDGRVKRSEKEWGIWLLKKLLVQNNYNKLKRNSLHEAKQKYQVTRHIWHLK